MPRKHEYGLKRDAFIPLDKAAVQDLVERSGRPFVKVVRVGEPGTRPHNRGYGYTDAPINSGGLFLIDLDSAQVLEEVTSVPWFCPDCGRNHPKVDPCPKRSGGGRPLIRRVNSES